MTRKIVFLFFFWLSNAMAEVSVFDANSNTLTIPTLRVGTTYYPNAILKLPPLGQWSVTSIGPASFSAPADTSRHYDHTSRRHTRSGLVGFTHQR